MAQSDREIEQLKRELERSQRTIGELSERLESIEGRTTKQGSQLEEMETQIFDLDERIGSLPPIRVFDAITLNLGGFLTQSFMSAFGEDSNESSFNQTLFEILIKAQITEDIAFFSALGFLREADLDFGDPENPTFRDFANRVPQIIAWANYQHSDALQFRAGRFVTPHGIINIEHFPPVLLEINQPQFLRPFSGASIFPNFLNGVQLHGKAFLRGGKDVLQYNVYGGVFVGGDADDLIGGLRLAYTLGTAGLTAGINYSHGRRGARADMTSGLGHFSIVPNRSLTTNNYDMVGFDVFFDKGMILWKNEIFYSLEDDEDNRLGAYTQPGIRLGDHWVIFYRFDFFDPGQGLEESTEHVFGVNFLPVPTVRLRAVFFAKHFDDPSTDANIFQLSATVSF